MVIARVRRAMPRNPDVMRVCDMAEASYDARSDVVRREAAVVRCPVCDARRAADAAAARRRRKRVQLVGAE
jgi:hypothetical protein